MSITTMTRLRIWSGVMVLLVLAGMLPAQHASAYQQTHVLTPEEANNIFYRWQAQRPTGDASGALHVERLIYAGLVLEASRQNSGDLSEDIFKLFDEYHELLGPRGSSFEYRNSLPYSTVARAMFDAALQVPAFRDGAERVYRELKAEVSNPLFDAYSAQERTVLRGLEEGNVLSGAFGMQMDNADQTGSGSDRCEA